ncbi:TRAP transporter large permease [Amorphus orientalis]|uniref:TRAP transporter large permease protein n=1 Tax=Amorphus orientalis TaxID=649198 RepID=A0AAE3VQV6_9HYPH|nr:TRAP transporter large permease subunit [Amorphus orientalis]MDQ0316520.1 tripartite ATP-independent transporter DctM subunit [Amorphus orientalis]
METYEILVVALLGSFIVLLMTGYPIAWILAGLSLIFTLIGIAGPEYFGIDTYFLDSWSDFAIVVNRIWNLMENWVLTALPMFIFMGLMLERSGLAESLMKNFVQVFGRFRGGLAIAAILIGILFAASTGIVGASVVLLTVLAMPIMLAQGYDKSLAAGVLASSGTLGILIPPSIMLVIMADQLSLSVGDLFLGAVMPGVILGFLYIAYVLIVALVSPKSAPAPTHLEPLTFKVILRTLISVMPPLILIFAVLGTIFLGVATPTEAAGIGAFGALLLALFNGRLSFHVLKEVSYETTYTTAFIFGIFVGATAFALVMRSLGGDSFIEHILSSLPFGPSGIVIFVLFLAFMMGFFLDWLEITLIFLPLMAPVIVTLGFDPVWFTVMFAVALQTSFLTPPVGFSLFYLKGSAPPEVTTIDVYKGVIPFVILQLIALALVFTYPQIVLWLPAQAY